MLSSHAHDVTLRRSGALGRDLAPAGALVSPLPRNSTPPRAYVAHPNHPKLKSPTTSPLLPSRTCPHKSRSSSSRVRVLTRTTAHPKTAHTPRLRRLLSRAVGRSAHAAVAPESRWGSPPSSPRLQSTLSRARASPPEERVLPARPITQVRRKLRRQDLLEGCDAAAGSGRADRRRVALAGSPLPSSNTRGGRCHDTTRPRLPKPRANRQVVLGPCSSIRTRADVRSSVPTNSRMLS